MGLWVGLGCRSFHFEYKKLNFRQYGVNGFHHGRMDRAGTKREIIQSAQDVESQQPIKRARNSNSNQGQAEPQQLTQQQPFQIVRYPDQLQVCYPKMPFKSKKLTESSPSVKKPKNPLATDFSKTRIFKKSFNF